jgi:hypothetical protein
MIQSRALIERECVDRVNQILSGADMPEIFRRMGQRFLGARSAGQYPETRLIVEILDERDGVVESHSYEVWGRLLRDVGGTEIPDPHTVANFLAVWMQEPLPPGDELKGDVTRRPLRDDE